MPETLKPMTVSRRQCVAAVAFVLLFAVAGGRTAEEPMLLFDLARAPVERIRRETAPDAVPAARHHVRKHADGLQFELAGQTYASCRWFIPIAADVAATCRVRFSVVAGNIASFTGRPNVSIVLVPRRSPTEPPAELGRERLVPVFSANGPEYQ
jgi:hypothetical protein